MILEQFLLAFYCRVEYIDFNGILHVTTKVINRQTQKQVGKITNDLNIQEMNDHISKSHTIISLMPFDWDKVLDMTKRAQLTSIAIATPIDNYNSMDSSVDISDMYL